VVHKTLIQKNDGDKSYRTLQWRLICFNTNQFELDFQRPRAMSSVLPSVAVPGGSTKPQYLMSASVKSSASDLRAMRMTRASIHALAEQPELDLIEASQTPDGAAHRADCEILQRRPRVRARQLAGDLSAREDDHRRRGARIVK